MRGDAAGCPLPLGRGPVMGHTEGTEYNGGSGEFGAGRVLLAPDGSPDRRLRRAAPQNRVDAGVQSAKADY